MKKLAMFFYIGCAFILSTGCGILNKTPSPEKLLDHSFESNVTVTWYDDTYKGDIRKCKNGSITVSLSGENLAEPLLFYCGEGGYGFEQGKLSFTAPQDALLPGSLLSSIERAFVMLLHADASHNGEELVLKAGSTILRCNKSDGTFISLTLEHGEVNFSEFVFSNQ